MNTIKDQEIKKEKKNDEKTKIQNIHTNQAILIFITRREGPNKRRNTDMHKYGYELEGKEELKSTFSRTEDSMEQFRRRELCNLRIKNVLLSSYYYAT